MKNISLLFGLLLLAAMTFAQAPQAFKYQAVARDTNGEAIINQQVSVKISLLIGNPEGTVVYSETHLTTTSNSGIFNLEIGSGTVETGSFAGISWGNDAIFIKIEMDVTGGDDFEFMGTSQLLSVPYSLFSNNGVPDGQNPGDMLFWDGTKWVDIPAGQNGQFLIFSNGVPTWGGVHLPILNTSAVTNITAYTAYCGGNIASDGGSPVTERGICWNTSPNPTTNDFKAIAGSGSGTFLAQMTLLEASTQYFVRSFATNSAGTSYGQDMTFYTSNGNITMTTTAVSSITTNSAISGGTIINNGGSSVIERGVCWNTAPYPTIAHYKTSDGAGNGVYVSNLTGLDDNTLYYLRAYATNGLGTSYGNVLTFTTLLNQPPAIPSEPIPADGSINQSITPILSWLCSDPENDPLTFDVYFGNENPPTQVSTAIADTFYTPDTLDFETTYYWKIVAHDADGNNTDGAIWSFTTKSEWACGDSLTDTRDNQKYATVQIGQQCWMAQNLNVGTRINGTSYQTNNGIIEKHCYDNSVSNCNVFGGLYQWDEMMGYTIQEGVQGICPENWHLPTDGEWTVLTNFVRSQPEYLCGGNVNYIAKSLASPNYWNSSTNSCDVGNSTSTNNITGFTVLPSGTLYFNGGFMHFNVGGFFWSTTTYSFNSAWTRALIYNDEQVSRTAQFRNSYSFSVRCIKDNVRKEID